MKIIILGKGQWGTALASLLTENKKEFGFWEIDTEIPDNSIIINCLPTQAIRQVLEKHGKNLKNSIFVNGAKGIEEITHKLPFEITTDVLGKNIDYFSLIGPGFAQEIIDQMPTLVNIGFIKDKNAKIVQNLFQTDYFRVRLVKGVKGLELSSAFKNIYAIACGLADGLGFGTNTKTKLIIVAIEEFYALSRSLSISIDTKMLPGTMGDLILTCTSTESRNFRFGQLLVKKDVKVALEEIGETTEGYTTVSSVPYFEAKSNTKLKLANFVYEVVMGKSLDPKVLFLDLVKNI